MSTDRSFITLPSSQLKLEFGGYSTPGNKPENQDAYTVYYPKLNDLSLKGATACIADGVSHCHHAQQASQTSVINFINDYYCTPHSWSTQTSVTKVLAALNHWLYQQGHHSMSMTDKWVTTFSSVIFKSQKAYIFHIGDCRVWLYRNNLLEPLTQDHVCNINNNKGQLHRALGLDNDLKIDFQMIAIEDNDLFLLTTDGLHNFLDKKQISIALSKIKTKITQTQLEQISKKLTEAALESGSDDNLSCLLVQIHQAPIVDIHDIHHKLAELIIPKVLSPHEYIDDYIILKIIHHGMRSHLYLVKHAKSNATLVLKAPSEYLADDPEQLEAFLKEQWVGNCLDHPGLMKTYPPPKNSQFIYLLCEYIQGQTLYQWILDHPQPMLEQVRDIINQISIALRALQRRGMVHRDLKPENIMVAATGNIKIIDFGAVKIPGLDEITCPIKQHTFGTLEYIAPECILGYPGDHRSDLYSLTMIAYEMVTGKTPFKVSFATNNIPKHFKHWQYTWARKYRNDLPVWFDLALKKGLEPRPERRYQALSELIQDLRQPNQELIKTVIRKLPFIDKDPVLFWQCVSLVLLLILLVQLFLN